MFHVCSINGFSTWSPSLKNIYCQAQARLRHSGSLRLSQALNQAYSGSLWLLLSDSDSDSEPVGHHPLPTTPQLLSMKEGPHKKVQKIRMVQNGPPYLSIKKKFRWIARGRTWSSPPSSARTSSIYLMHHFQNAG